MDCTFKMFVTHICKVTADNLTIQECYESLLLRTTMQQAVVLVKKNKTQLMLATKLQIGNRLQLSWRMANGNVAVTESDVFLG